MDGMGQITCCLSPYCNRNKHIQNQADNTGHNQSSPTHCSDPPTVHGVSLTWYLLQVNFKLCKDDNVWVILFLLWGGANSLRYMHARFPDDKYKLHHSKTMRTVLGLVVS